jgi:hypothetical protein
VVVANSSVAPTCWLPLVILKSKNMLVEVQVLVDEDRVGGSLRFGRVKGGEVTSEGECESSNLGANQR